MAKPFNNKKAIITKVDELISMANSKGFSDSSYLITYLKRIKNTDLISSFKTEDILYEVISRVINCGNQDSSAYIDLSKKMFNNIVYDPSNKEQLYLYYKYLDKLFSDDDILDYFSNNIEDFKTINSLFSEGVKYSYDFFEYFCDYIISSENDAKIVMKYALASRPYFVVDAPYYASLKLFSEQSLDMHGRELEKFYEESLELDRRSAGIYKIREEDIVENTRKLEKAQKGVDNCVAKTAELEGKLSTISDEAERRLEEVVDGKTAEIRAILDGAKNELNSSIEKATGAYASRQGEFISALDEREKIFKAMSQNSIDTMDHYSREISKRLDAHPELEASVVFSKSPLLDKRIPVDERFERALALKDPKAFYHEKFDLILKYMLMNIPVMLVGPSGAGKTYTAEQVGALIGCVLYNFGFVADEYSSIKGFMDVSGNYVKTPFYDVFKYGGVAFFDEIDNSESKALIELNKITGGNGFQPYIFPNGDRITPSPDFNIISAANTWGDGASPAYPTREVMDRSTLNRFAQIEYGFDPNVEKKILKGHEEIYNFCLAFRKALIDRESNDLVSTKDMDLIKTQIEAKIFSWEEIMSKTFIKNRRSEELKAIREIVRQNTKTSTRIYTEFSNCVDGKSRELVL